MTTKQSRAAAHARRADRVARLPRQHALFPALDERASAGQPPTAHEERQVTSDHPAAEVAASGDRPGDIDADDTDTPIPSARGAATRRSIPLAAIAADPCHHETRGADADVRPLAESIAEHGLLQAPLLRPHPTQKTGYLVVFGHRRVAAHRLLGRTTIDVRVQALSEAQALILSCVENIHRRDRSPAEEMDLVGVLIETLGSQEAVAAALRVSATWVSKRCRVADHPPVAAAVATRAISLDHAYDIIARSDGAADLQDQLGRALNEGQSQGTTRQRTGGARRGRTRPASAPDSFIVSDRNPTDDDATAPATHAPPWPTAVDTGSNHPALDTTDRRSPGVNARAAEAQVNRAMLRTVHLFDATATAPAHDVWPLLMADVALVRDLRGDEARAVSCDTDA